MKRSVSFFVIVMFVLIQGAFPSYGSDDFGGRQERDVHFRVKWDGKIVSGIAHVSGLRRVTEAIRHRPGGDPNSYRFSPGLSEYIPIVLKRPRTHDKEFERWANKVLYLGAARGAEVSLRDYRKDVIIELFDERGKVLMAFKVYRCWPSEYIALTDLDIERKGSAMEVLILHHEGWERDYDID